MRYTSQPWLSLATEGLTGKKQNLSGVKVQGNHTNQTRNAAERSRRLLLAVFFAMVKRCSALGCASMALKGSSLGFVVFLPTHPARAGGISGSLACEEEI